jgi:hypothetical protein
MVNYDLNFFNTVAGTGGVGGVGGAFGIPSCLLTLGQDVLSLLPSSVLAIIVASLQAGVQLADAVVKAIFAKLRDMFGLAEWDTEDGLFTYISKSLGFGNDSDFAATMAVLGGLLGAVGAAGTFASQLYSNYQLVAGQIQRIQECIKSLRDMNKIAKGFSDVPMDPEAFRKFIDDNYAAEKYQANSALQFIDLATRQIEYCNETIAARQRDPDLEPKFRPELCNVLEGTGFNIECDPAQAEEPEVFRLIFGPPKSIHGQFVLSNDGLYFDSQTSGITPALTYLNNKKSLFPKGEVWKFSHNPNLGGRGDSFSINDLKLYVNTILDPASINDSPYLQTYYDKDGFLQELIGNRNKRIYDLSAQLNDLQTDGAPTSIVLNFRQSIVSENATLNQKINKRKKQIELAVVLPSIYGTGTRFTPGTIPINDFSYLRGINMSVDLQKQRALSFNQADVAGVVSPIVFNTTYVVPKTHTKNSNLDHLLIADNGAGAIIYDGSSVSSVDGVILQTENLLTTDSLFAMYNFLDTDVENPSSTNFTLRNSASESDELYAQLVATGPEVVFNRGLGVPYLQGITKNSNSTPTQASALGSFVKLPNAAQFNDLLYSRSGASIDFWAHVPSLTTSAGYTDGNVSSLYRIVLGNENVGFEGNASSTDPAYIQNNFGIDAVRGFLMGFSRDRRLTSESYPSNSNADNPASSTVFFIAPTQSISLSAATLVNRSYFDGQDCNLATRYHSMVVPVSADISGLTLSTCSDEFCHIAVTFDPIEDKISFYMDGVNIATSSMSYVFGIPPYTMPNLPTFKNSTNSFEYDAISVGPNAPAALKQGPKLDTYFTPWIVGGGYTDGMYYYGNFMGGSYGGIISGLRGHLGSIKFYSKPLKGSEVLNNYNAQSAFFKNIDTTKL